MVAGESPEAQHEPMSTERKQSVSPQPESSTRQSLLAKIRDFFARGVKDSIKDIGSGRVQKGLNPFPQTLPPQEPPSPNPSEPSKS